MPIRHTTSVEIQIVQNPQRIGRESVATAFVAGESGFIDHGDLVTEAMQGGCTCGS
jgi:hypothetical protein